MRKLKFLDYTMFEFHFNPIYIDADLVSEDQMGELGDEIEMAVDGYVSALDDDIDQKLKRYGLSRLS